MDDMLQEKEEEYGKSFSIQNGNALTVDDWAKAIDLIIESLEDWDGSCFDDTNSEYRDQVYFDGKTVAFELDAEINDGDMVFGDYIQLKRVR